VAPVSQLAPIVSQLAPIVSQLASIKEKVTWFGDQTV